MPFSMVPASTSNVSGAATRSYHSTRSSSSSTSRPAASWRTTLPQAMVITPGCRIIGTSSIGRPKPMMSKRTIPWL